jgi:hypothetical protein
MAEGRTPCRREARSHTHREALPGHPPRTTDELSLGRDELLAKQPVFGDERGASTQEIGGETAQEPNEI